MSVPGGDWRHDGWQQYGPHAQSPADRPGRFLAEHVAPVLWHETAENACAPTSEPICYEEQFWGREGNVAFAAAELRQFRVFDWFPRAPGVYWSRRAHQARRSVYAAAPSNDPELGQYWSPMSKKSLIEDGGIGTVRLRPRRIDDEDCWFATAVRGRECHAGIPLVIPHTLLHQRGIEWGHVVNLRGRVRFLQDVGLDDVGSSVHHTRPIVLVVDDLVGVAKSAEPAEITPVSLFRSSDPQSHRDSYSRQMEYTFVQCFVGNEGELDAAGDWMERYATKHGGRVITNFDEQRPMLADAPLSYQRLVAKTYERELVQQFIGPVYVDRIDQVTQRIASVHMGDIRMGHEIHVGGSAIINIDSVLTNVTQTINRAPGLELDQKRQLDKLVAQMNSELNTLKASHAEEANEIAVALQKTVAHAAKPASERKHSLLKLSAKGLKDAAEVVKDIAPNLISTADLIAQFITGL